MSETNDPNSFCAGMPAPVKEHEWLQKFIGEWDAEVEMMMGPGQPSMKMTSRETSRMLGGFWLVAQSKSTTEEMPFESVLSLGYDPDKKIYIGSWIDSMTSRMWKYEGELNTSGTTLTLNTEGPLHTDPSKLTKFQEVTEFRSDNERFFKSIMLAEDGNWVTILTVRSIRVG